MALFIISGPILSFPRIKQKKSGTFSLPQFQYVALYTSYFCVCVRVCAAAALWQSAHRLSCFSSFYTVNSYFFFCCCVFIQVHVLTMCALSLFLSLNVETKQLFMRN